MFKIDEIVVYGSIGVCKVIEIGTPDFAMADEDRLYYYLEPLYQKGTVYAPTDSTVSIRKVISQDEANELLEQVDSIEVEPLKTRSMQQITKHYQEIIDSHDCYKLMELTKRLKEKKINSLKDNKKLGQIDKKFMKKSEELLFGEMAVALELEKTQVADMVYEKITIQNQEADV